MQIKTLTVTNFKSLVDFRVSLSKCSCLIGLNGSGKSTVLHFIDFLAQLVRGDLNGWLADRKWKASDLKCKFLSSARITFEITFEDDGYLVPGQWGGVYSITRNRCVNERISLGDELLKVSNNNNFSVSKKFVKQ